MRVFQGKRILITGASSGIGRALAEKLSTYGARLGLASRNQAALEELKTQLPGEAIVLPTDVTQIEDCKRAVDATVEQLGGLDILVCSAGVSLRAYFEGTQLDAFETVMRVNFFGTLYMTHFALPHVKATRGSLVAISSLSGHRPIPSYAVYGASKAAIQSLYETLHVELKRDGVHVGVASPGFVDTPLRERVLGPDGKPWKEPPRPPFTVMPVEKCVRSIIRMIAKRKREALIPWFTRPLMALDRFSSRNSIGNFLLARYFPPENRAT